MKKTERIYMEIMHKVLEEKKFFLSQAVISRGCRLSLSTVNKCIQNLTRIGAIEKKARGFSILNVKKVLYYWCNVRNLEKDIVYSTCVSLPPTEIEKSMPSEVIYTGFSGYKLKFNSTPADYSEIYVYSENLDEIKRRFPKKQGRENLFVLKMDSHLKKLSKKNIASSGQLFVDLWNLKSWYANEFIKEFEGRINGVLE